MICLFYTRLRSDEMPSSVASDRRLSISAFVPLLITFSIFRLLRQSVPLHLASNNILNRLGLHVSLYGSSWLHMPFVYPPLYVFYPELPFPFSAFPCRTQIKMGLFGTCTF